MAFNYEEEKVSSAVERINNLIGSVEGTRSYHEFVMNNISDFLRDYVEEKLGRDFEEMSTLSDEVEERLRLYRDWIDDANQRASTVSRKVIEISEENPNHDLVAAASPPSPSPSPSSDPPAPHGDDPVTTPSASVPSASVPSASVPSASIPSASVPSATIPSATIPSSTNPTITLAATTIPSTSIPSTSNPSTTTRIAASTIPSTTTPSTTTNPSTRIAASTIPSTTPSTTNPSTRIAASTIPSTTPSTRIASTTIPTTTTPSTTNKNASSTIASGTTPSGAIGVGKTNTKGSSSTKGLTSSLKGSVKKKASSLIDSLEAGATRLAKGISPKFAGEDGKVSAGLLAAGGLAGAGIVAGGGYLLGKRFQTYIFTPEDWEEVEEVTQNAIINDMKTAGFDEPEIELFKNSTFKIRASELNEHTNRIDKADEIDENMEAQFKELYNYSIFDDNGDIMRYFVFITMIIDGKGITDEFNMYNVLNPILEESDNPDFLYTGINMEDYIYDEEEEEEDVEISNDPTKDDIKEAQSIDAVDKDWLKSIGLN